MFFNAHVHHSIERNNGVADPQRIFGAILADSGLTEVIDWEDLSDEGLHDRDTITALTKTLRPHEMSLGHGMMDHHELDLLAHNSFEGGLGYAYSHQTPELRELVAEAYGLETPENARLLAHNFIESGVDINLLQDRPAVGDHLNEALQTVDIYAATKRVADFFKLSRNDTEAKLVQYKDYIQGHDFATIGGWASLWVDLAPALTGNTADEQATERALLLAVDLTTADYRQVLE